MKKAVNRALRQMGKRSPGLNARALEVASRLKGRASRAACWIGAGARQELAGGKVRARLGM